MQEFKRGSISLFVIVSFVLLSFAVKVIAQTLINADTQAVANPLSSITLYGVGTNGKFIKILPGTCLAITTSAPFTLNDTCGAGNSFSPEDEVPIGAINGTNAIFTTSKTVTVNSQHLYRNGVRLSPANGDYNIQVPSSGSATVTFAVGTVPQTGDKLEIDYLCSGAGC